jgi:sporulation protein YqfC
MGASNVKKRVAEVAELPKDIIMDAPRVIMTGNFQFNIENHRGLIEYGCNCIRINTSIGVYKVTGSDLSISSIAPEEIIITGNIEDVDISC